MKQRSIAWKMSAPSRKDEKSKKKLKRKRKIEGKGGSKREKSYQRPQHQQRLQQPRLQLLMFWLFLGTEITFCSVSSYGQHWNVIFGSGSWSTMLWSNYFLFADMKIVDI